MRARQIIVLFIPAAVLAASCILDGFNRVDEFAAGASAGATTSHSGQAGSGGLGGSGPVGLTGGSGGQGGQPCEHASYPEPPAVADAGGDLNIVVALRSLLLAEQTDGGALGIDLDQTCTCQGDGPSCVHDPNANHCDGPGGRDNAVADLIAMLGGAMGETKPSELFSQAAEQGEWSLLLRISEYSGNPDDDQVTVAWYLTSGLGGSPPAWDGADLWPVATDTLATGGGPPSVDHPLFVDESAYVSSGLLVAQLPEARIAMRAGQSRLVINLIQVGLMGRFVEQNDGWALRDGVLTAQVDEPALFQALSSFRDNNGEALCTDDFFYTLGKTVFCATRDILVDGGSSDQPCNGFSWGAGFSADPALLGTPIDPGLQQPGCPQQTDPQFDSCD